MVDNSFTTLVSAERAPLTELKRQAKSLAEQEFTRQLLDAVPTPLAILNRYRQIVCANRAMHDLVGGEVTEVLSGLRVGEALGCLHSRQTPGGCGASEACQACGNLQAILASACGRKGVRESRILRERNGHTEALDLEVWATVLQHQGETFTVLALKDISHQKRRRALERIFFHDILNVAGSIKGFAELLRDYDPADKPELFRMIHVGAEQIIEEIEAQRTLLAAEHHELRVAAVPLDGLVLLRQLVDLYRHHEAAENRTLEIHPASAPQRFSSDQTLLIRVLGNMIKNALEASCDQDTVTVGCGGKGGGVEFWVHNPGIIPRNNQVQIFQRSFSTKGHGRGLGTYSMKILSEALQGSVTFTSNESEGTIFRLSLPKAMA